MKYKHILPLTIVALVGSFSGFTALSQARQENSPSLAQNTPIGDLNSTRSITISGTIVAWGEADENEFILQDESGEIVVDAGPRWMQDLNLSIGDTVTVTGERDGREFDAFSITYADGTVVEIRAHQDPISWSEGHHNHHHSSSGDSPSRPPLPQGTSISGTIVAWGEADENEFILQTPTRRIRVDAGPRWMQDLNLSIGDTVTVTGERDGREFDAFFITYADGTVVEIRAHQDDAVWEEY